MEFNRSLTLHERYSAYCAWCWMLKIDPASFDSWEYDSRKISDLGFTNKLGAVVKTPTHRVSA
jgi:hypothetical protein